MLVTDYSMSGPFGNFALIRQAQHCGFSLVEIRELLALKESDKACCNDVRSVAIQKKLLLEHKIKALHVMSLALNELITVCSDATRPLAECPIIEALESSLAKQQKGKRNG